MFLISRNYKRQNLWDHMSLHGICLPYFVSFVFFNCLNQTFIFVLLKNIGCYFIRNTQLEHTVVILTVNWLVILYPHFLLFQISNNLESLLLVFSWCYFYYICITKKKCKFTNKNQELPSGYILYLLAN